MPDAPDTLDTSDKPDKPDKPLDATGFKIRVQLLNATNNESDVVSASSAPSAASASKSTPAVSDDDVQEVTNPTPRVLEKRPLGTDTQRKDGGEDDDDDDCVYVGEQGPAVHPGRDLPHARFHCCVHPIDVHKQRFDIESASNYCPNCYCSFCDRPLSECGLQFGFQACRFGSCVDGFHTIYRFYERLASMIGAADTQIHVHDWFWVRYNWDSSRCLYSSLRRTFLVQKPLVGKEFFAWWWHAIMSFFESFEPYVLIRKHISQHLPPDLCMRAYYLCGRRYFMDVLQEPHARTMTIDDWPDVFRPLHPEYKLPECACAVIRHAIWRLSVGIYGYASWSSDINKVWGVPPEVISIIPSIRPVAKAT